MRCHVGVHSRVHPRPKSPYLGGLGRRSVQSTEIPMSADHQNAQSPSPLAARSPRPRRQGALPPRPRADRAPSHACSNTSSADATSVCAGQCPNTRDRVPIICGSPAWGRRSRRRRWPARARRCWNYDWVTPKRSWPGIWIPEHLRGRRGDRIATSERPP